MIEFTIQSPNILEGKLFNSNYHPVEQWLEDEMSFRDILFQGRTVSFKESTFQQHQINHCSVVLLDGQFDLQRPHAAPPPHSCTAPHLLAGRDSLGIRPAGPETKRPKRFFFQKEAMILIWLFFSFTNVICFLYPSWLSSSD